MLSLTGRVLNVFKRDGRTDKKSGEVYEDTHHVQLIGEIPQENGTKKMDMFTLKTDQPERFEKALNQVVAVPVQIYNIDGQAGLYMEKGVKIDLIKDAGKAA